MAVPQSGNMKVVSAHDRQTCLQEPIHLGLRVAFYRETQPYSFLSHPRRHSRAQGSKVKLQGNTSLPPSLFLRARARAHTHTHTQIWFANIKVFYTIIRNMLLAKYYTRSKIFWDISKMHSGRLSENSSGQLGLIFFSK